MNDEGSNTDLSDFEDWQPYGEVDRKRGIFTQKDREYLIGEVEIDGQDERNLRYRMRQRVQDSFLDLNLLANQYPDEEFEKVIENGDCSHRSVVDHLITIAYRVSRMSTENPDDRLKEAIQRAVTNEHSDRERRDDQFVVHGAFIDLQLSVEPYEYTIEETVQICINEGINTEHWERLNRYVDLHIDPLITEQEMEERDWTGRVEMCPPGADEVIEFHPLIADYIREYTNRYR